MQQQFILKPVSQLFEKIVEKVGRPLTYSNRFYFEEEINTQLNDSKIHISARYLYDKYRAVQKAEKESQTTISFSLAYLNALARFLGHFDFHDFQNPPSSDNSTAISPILLSCKGFWYSYVRCNSGKKDVLVSPIQMHEAGGKMWMTLYGPINIYTGELLLRGACIFCTLDSGNNKILYVTYKIGEALNPAVLQGTFCGMSTAGDPIAGREVLVKQREIQQLEEMEKPYRIYLNNEKMVKERLDWRIAKYFEHYHENYIKIINVGTFTLDDLVK